VTNQQKLIIAILTVIAVGIFSALGCLLLVFIQTATSEPGPSLAAVAQPPPSLTPSLAPSSTATTPPAQPAPVRSTQTALPTPTSTRVITITPTATPRPTPVNCIHDISNFEASGIMTNEQVETYLRETIPLSHLDRCVRIRYVPETATVHSTPASGQFMPVFRHISVYSVEGATLTPDELLDTLVHEIGHNVHFNMRSDNLELANHWADLHEQGLGFVSEYAQTNEYEDFAETYMVYVRQPQILQLYSPIKYEFMRQEVFDGYEYPR
jgi:hypothetical protein